MSEFSDLMSSGLMLKGVNLLFEKECPNDISTLLLDFDNYNLKVSVLEDDSLDVSVLRSLLDCELIRHDVTNDFPWKNCIGKPIRWLWEMENNQGYSDGFQIEFAQSIQDRGFTVQFLGIASRIDVRIVKSLI